MKACRSGRGHLSI